MVRDTVEVMEAEPVTVLVRQREGVCDTVKEEEGLPDTVPVTVIVGDPVKHPLFV